MSDEWRTRAGHYFFSAFHSLLLARCSPLSSRTLLLARYSLSVFLLLLILCGSLGAEQKTLYEKESPYGPIIVTEDEPGVRTLYFERFGALQSVVKLGDPDDLRLSYTKVMLAGLGLCEEPATVLVVGLGGGTIPMFLHKHYPKAVIDVVDINPDVVKVARQFFGFKEDATLRAHVADGRDFITKRPGTYDLIFLDAFGADSIPYHLATREFLSSVKKALTPRGAALGNIWGPGANVLYHSMLRTYLAVFDEVHLLEVGPSVNQIVIGMAKHLGLTRDGMVSRARRVSRSHGFRFDMGESVEWGYRDVEKVVSGGSVLTDDAKPAEAR